MDSPSTRTHGGSAIGPKPGHVLYWEDVQEGQELPSLTKHSTTQQLVRYAGASRDFYQIHYDKDFAIANGLSGVILHGAIKMAFLGQIVTNWIDGSGTLKKLSAKYGEMDYPGQPLYIKGRVAKKYAQGTELLVNCEMWVENTKGEKTTQGTAVVSLPSKTAGHTSA